MPTPNEPEVPEKKSERKPIRPIIGAVFSALGLLLAELLLPALIAGGVVWYLFSSYNIWGLERTLSLILFGVAVVLLALILSVLSDSLLAGIRNIFAARGAKLFNLSGTRMVKMAVGGIILPIGLIVAANLVTLPNATTAMAWLISAGNKPVSLTPPGEVGMIAASTKNPATKLYAIQVLQYFRSPEALAQLIQIADNDASALTNGGTRAALVKAVAVYGLSAKTPLLNLFNSVDPTLGRKSSEVTHGLYESYFAGSFDSLQADLAQANPDAGTRDARAAQIQAAQADLKKALSDMEENAPSGMGGNPRLDFVIQAFLATDLTGEKDILAFAKATAADPRFSSQVRGDALLLIAKLGDKSDMNGLYPYLKTGDEVVQARALQAIAALQSKLNHTVGK
jgi:hypothetical protein